MQLNTSMSLSPTKSATKSQRKSKNTSKPCCNWRKSSKSCRKFVLKSVFISKVFDNKFKVYLQKVSANLKMNMRFSGFDDFESKSSIILLLMKETLEFATSKTNELINY